MRACADFKFDYENDVPCDEQSICTFPHAGNIKLKKDVSGLAEQSVF